MSKTPPTWSSTASSPSDEYHTFQKAEAFLWNVRVHLHYLLGRAEERLSFDVQPALAAALGYRDADKPRRAVEAFMRAYFLVAKDVGDLTRIFCAALEEQHRKPRPSLARMLPGFLKPRSTGDDFYVENGRLTADPAMLPRAIRSISCASSRSPTPRMSTSIPMRCAPSPARST